MPANTPLSRFRPLSSIARRQRSYDEYRRIWMFQATPSAGLKHAYQYFDGGRHVQASSASNHASNRDGDESFTRGCDGDGACRRLIAVGKHQRYEEDDVGNSPASMSFHFHTGALSQVPLGDASKCSSVPVGGSAGGMMNLLATSGMSRRRW